VEIDHRERRVNLSIKTDTFEGVTVVHVKGELDVYTAPMLKETLDSTMDARERFVLDLTQVRFIDSTGLGVLVGSLQEARADSADFPLVLDDPYLLKIFHITGFDGVFSIYPQVSDAVRGN